MTAEMTPPRDSDDSGDPDSLLARTEHLCRRVVDDLGFDGVGVAIIVSAHLRDLVFATDSTAGEIDEQQFTTGEGPCLDSYLADRLEAVADIEAPEAVSRWPAFASAIGHLDARGLHAHPLRAEGRPFGALEFYSRAPRSIDAETERSVSTIADALADTMSAELETGRDPSIPLSDGAFSRGNVHLASGMLSVQMGITVDDALARLRSAAFAQNIRITVLARDIVERRRGAGPDDL